MADDTDSIEFYDNTNKLVGEMKIKGDTFKRAIDLAKDLTDAVKDKNVQLNRSKAAPTDDQALWVAIRNRTQALGFNQYNDFINQVLNNNQCVKLLSGLTPNNMDEETYGAPSIKQKKKNLENRPTIHGTDAYQLLKLATEAFLIYEAGVVIDENLFDANLESRRLGRAVTHCEIKQVLERYLSYNSSLPYLDRIVEQIVGLDQERQKERLPYAEAILQHRLTCPSMIELIWSYWHEEGMLVQTMNAIALRFQNKRRSQQDPLANLTLDHLRPLNNIIWGFIQDEYSRLTVQRRAYEYDSQYGITLVGKAVPILDSADSRSQFIGAFHNLLYRTAMFYREDDDTTVVADAFALLNALREVHLILAEGAHNQFGDLPWTARREMLMTQWILARPEMKEFLRGRYSVPYQETWMGAVDDMKRLQGWGDVTVTHFRELGVYGEQILLSIRYGDWIDVNDQDQAKNWARGWRPEIQRYMHAYHAVSGVDLTAETVDARSAEARYAQPSMLLQNRLAMQQPKNSLTGGSTRRLANSKGAGFASLSGEVPKRLRIDRDDD